MTLFMTRLLLVATLSALALSAALTACGSDDTEEPRVSELPTPEQVGETPAKTSPEPTSTARAAASEGARVPAQQGVLPVAQPVATPTAGAPIPSPTANVRSPGDSLLLLSADATWREAFETFSDSAQNCIRDELGQSQLDSALEHRLLKEGMTEQWEVTIFRCLEPDVARSLMLYFMSASARQEGIEVNDEVEACWSQALSNIDAADIVAADLPENTHQDFAALEELGNQIVACIDASQDSGTLTFISISAGGEHTCGVRSDGLVECWGSNHSLLGFGGQATPPSGSFASVSAGGEHTCGVRTDGSVECWG
ncbi:MAG: hypothetical protein F4Y49_09325, partial [Dehalococcoidia bacterium]|nr:hypothetical protein [Dehalococcoidia bacterium]